MASKGSANPQNKYLQSRLRLTSSIDSLDDPVLLQKAIDEIMTIIGRKQALYLMAKSASIEQCLTINSILHGVLPEIHSIIDNINSAHASSLSDCIIHEICGYLQKRDIRAFRATSKQIAIVCLQHQTKIDVNVFNGNTFFEHQQMNIAHFIQKGPASTYRYYPNTPMYRFHERFNKECHIVEENQLLIVHQRHKDQTTIFDINTVEFERIRSLPSWSNVYVIDKQKIVILNQNGARKMNPEVDSVDILKDEYKFLILEYFDVVQQNSTIAQMLLCHHCSTYSDILSYITHKFIYIDYIDNAWHSVLLSNLKQMDPSHPKLCIFKHNTRARPGYQLQYYDDAKIEEQVVGDSISESSKSFLCLTFQINPKNPWFEQTDQMDDIKKNVFGFCQNVNDFYGPISNLSVSVKYLFSPLGRSPPFGYLEIVPNIFHKFNSQNKINFNMKRFNCSGLLRQKLSCSLGNIVAPEQIELFKRESRRTRVIWSEPLLPPNLGIGLHHVTFCFAIVPYNTKNVASDERIYRVKIYHQRVEQCKLFFKHKSQFIAKDFINDISEHCPELLNSNVSSVLTHENQCEFKYRRVYRFAAYKWNDMYNTNVKRNSVTDLQLYMIPTGCNDKFKLKLRIRFVSIFALHVFKKQLDINTVHEVDYDGFPLIVWVNKNDTLQEILNEWDISENIRNIYRVNVGNKMVDMDDEKRRECKPFDFLEDNPNDYILIVQGHTYRDTYIEQSYPSWVSTDF
eukprot:236449_1